tara:strand:+ start:59 stop:952 length:894 start_codon:yes stop_codon:yes gene_type:complete
LQTLPNHKNKKYGGAWSIHDSSIKSLFYNTHFYWPEHVSVSDFLWDYGIWIQRGNNLVGYSDYKSKAYCNGTTEAFDKFYCRHTDKRLRLWRGEYFYHQIQRRELFNNFAWIDECAIMQGDVVAVSMPFSDTGNIPDDYDNVMQQCVDKEVPVLVDMAYLSLTKGITYNIHYPCIETVTTSLSKVFPVEHMRIGMRMNRESTDDTLDAYVKNDFPYVNTVGVEVGYRLIKHYEQNWVYNKWCREQQKICEELEVEPSNCVILGIDTKQLYPEYNRGGKTNRLCFSKLWDGRQGDLIQ